MKKQIYIIEHLEPELFEWCSYEYESISKIVGKDNLWFTNLKTEENCKKLNSFGRCFTSSLKELDLDNSATCVLDPEADKTLEPTDAEKFDYLVFGGILGDYPPKKRTKKKLTKFLVNVSVRNIGEEQMSTDNAVFTVKQIMAGKRFKDLKFMDRICVKLNEFESVDLPYRYNIVDGKPFMSSKVIRYLKNKKGF